MAASRMAVHLFRITIILVLVVALVLSVVLIALDVTMFLYSLVLILSEGPSATPAFVNVSVVACLIGTPLLGMLLLFVFRVVTIALESVVERYWQDNWDRLQAWKAQILDRCR